jgi:LPXTG-motif cell wall-anchored protein
VIRLPTLALVAALSIAASALPAGATEFEPKPVLAVSYGCGESKFHYAMLMYNQGNDWTTFTLSAQIGALPAAVTTHDVAPFSVVTVDRIVPEGEVGAFHVTNPDPPGVDDLRTVLADCKPPVPSTTSTTSSTVPKTTTTTSTSTTSTTSTSTTSTTLPKPATSTTTSTSTSVPKAGSTTSTSTTSTQVPLVAGITQTRTPAQPVAVQGAQELAVTGSGTSYLGLVGGGLVMVGLASGLLARRRRLDIA